MLAFVSPCFVLSFLVMTSMSLPLRSRPPRQDDSPRVVVAHHMVGNTYPYQQRDWEDDIALASANGIDAFALNYGTDEWQPGHLDDAYAAATKYPNFKLFLSMDMTVLPCASPNDAQTLRNTVLKYTDHPSQFKYNGKTFVSTFAGESCSFGQGNSAQGWSSQFANHPDLSGKIVFVPSFFADPAQFSQFSDVMDGDFNWNGGWPINLTQDQANTLNNQVNNPSTAGPTISVAGFASGGDDSADASSIIGALTTDDQHLQALAGMSGNSAKRDQTSNGRVYMASVSPWFFTHFGADTFNKNFMYYADEHLYARRWENLIAARNSVNIIQILTWNDWGESSYISPVKGALPQGSDAWVDGMPHDGFLALTKYYAEGFKTGQTPTITNDTIVLVSRPHPAEANAADPLDRPKGHELITDKFWATILLKEPAQVSLSTSSDFSNAETFDLPAGVSKLSLPISAGQTMSAKIQRNGATVVETSASDFTFQGSPQKYNFNAFVSSASA